MKRGFSGHQRKKMEESASDSRFPGKGIPAGGDQPIGLKPFGSGADDVLLKFFKTNALPVAVNYTPMPNVIQPPSRSSRQNSDHPPSPMPPPQLRNIGLEPFRPAAVVSSSVQPSSPYNVTQVSVGGPAAVPATSSQTQPVQSPHPGPHQLPPPKPENYVTNSELSDINGMRSMLAGIPGVSTFGKDVDLSGLSPAQKSAIEAVFAGKNILLTGPAGTGKSHTIKRIKEVYTEKKLNIGITSTTGASAILIEGKTIHSWAGIGICGTKEAALKNAMTFKAPQERIRTTSLLVIDEISMMSDIVLDILDYVFRAVRANDRAFGGMQVVLCGDFFQLKPVKCDTFAFESPNWNNLIHEVHELTQIFRQENAAFCRALNEIRIGEISPITVKLFESRIGKEFIGDIKPTELYPVNEDVDHLNESELWKLATETNRVREVQALDEIIEKPRPRKEYTPKFIQQCKERMNKDCIAPEILAMAIGAQVMLIKNINVEAGLANGSRATITGFGPHDEPVVKFISGHEMQLQTMTWYMRVNETAKIKRTQFPIKLAWAISLHKSQGCSLDLARIDLGGKVFQDGMSYTGLSRVRSLEGLSIIAIDWERVMTNKKVKEFYAYHRRLKDRK